MKPLMISAFALATIHPVYLPTRRMALSVIVAGPQWNSERKSENYDKNLFSFFFFLYNNLMYNNI